MRNRRKRHLSGTEVDSDGSWAVSYGDLVTLLLTFFIIFFTTDKFQTQKSLKLDVLAKQQVMSREIASVLHKSFSPDDKVLQDGQQKFQQDIQGKVYQAGQKVIVEFSGVSFFKSGKTDLNQQAKKALAKFYSAYSPHMGQYNLGIRAFTDPRKVRANTHRFQDNLELSALRSVSVMRFFQTAGVPLLNMKLSGYGELTLTEDDLKTLSASERTPSALNDLARTAVLVIEPREEK